MASEIIQEINDNLDDMQRLIGQQKFNIEDAHRFLKRYFNVIRCVEGLEKSRDKWKNKYIKLRKKQ